MNVKIHDEQSLKFFHMRSVSLTFLLPRSLKCPQGSYGGSCGARRVALPSPSLTAAVTSPKCPSALTWEARVTAVQGQSLELRLISCCASCPASCRSQVPCRKLEAGVSQLRLHIRITWASFSSPRTLLPRPHPGATRHHFQVGTQAAEPCEVLGVITICSQGGELLLLQSL